jgi:hypothetical protein
VWSDPVLRREVTLRGPKCEDTRISKGQSPEVILAVRWKERMVEDLPFRRKSLREKRGCVGQELTKAKELEFI